MPQITRELNATRKLCAVQGSSGLGIQYRQAHAQRAMHCSTSPANRTVKPRASIKMHAANPSFTSTLKLQSAHAKSAPLIRTRIRLHTL